MSVDLILQIIGLICLVLAAVNVKVGTLNLVAAGLAFWLLSVIL
jgi:hypothetical protein